MNTLTQLPEPVNTKAAVLFELITRREISEQDMRQNGFRMRITELKRMGLNIQEKIKKGKNQFGNFISYKVRYLFLKDLPAAKELYNELNKK